MNIKISKMATCSSRNLLQKWTKQIQWTQMRAAHKFKTKNPRPQVMERRVFEAITKPIYPTKYIPYQSCAGLKLSGANEEEVNPYEQFLIRQLKVLIESSQTILVCHRLPCSNQRLQTIRVALKANGLTIKITNHKHVESIIQGTQLENLTPLLQSTTVMLTSPEIIVGGAVDTLKKIPELLLLGGFLGDRLVTKDQLQDISKLPPMEQMLGQLCATLNQGAGGKTLSLLNSHQQSLTTNLQQYQKQKSEKDS